EDDGANAARDGSKQPINRNIISKVPAWAIGLGPSRKLDTSAFAALQKLHHTITTQSPKSSWSGSPTDPRQRAFGFLPDTLGYDSQIREKLDISMPWRAAEGENNTEKKSECAASNAKDTAKNEEDEERRRNEQAMVILENIPEGAKEAIEDLCGMFRDDLKQSADTTHLADFLCYKNLIAAQPNLHNGRELLPMHFDHPLKDGFGVVIVTISMQGSGKILLQDSDGENRLAMPLQAGEAYMISNQARDTCVHGVLTDVGQDHRQSLNLRFGLHDVSIGDNSAVVSASEVLEHWEAPSAPS
ncbi:MAG: hypothetical protein SGARI_000466, partial [Bacillariaceae sp.]